MSLVDRMWLTVPGASPAAWAKRFDILPFSHPCIDCGALRVTTIPFASGRFRGLAAPTCACGNDRGPYAVVLVRPDEQDIPFRWLEKPAPKTKKKRPPR